MPPRIPLASLVARGTASSAVPPDETVYLHFEGDDRGRSWPVANYGEQGIFTAAQEMELASRFGFSPALVSELSLYVGNALDAESMTTMTRVSRRKAVTGAEVALRRAVRHARQDDRRHGKLVEVLLACSAQFAEAPSDSALLSHAQTLARNPNSSLTDLLDAADAVLARTGSAALLAPADRREVWDGRREHIMRSCCYVWMDAGKPLTYTTRSDRPSKKQREGSLFDLIRTVMGMVLSKGKLPSDETIRKDIDQFRKLMKRHPEILDGR